MTQPYAPSLDILPGYNVVVAKFVDVPRIDLLKLDIEGAEESFLTEYPEILAKTQVLLGEFHLKEIDYALCWETLEKSGLSFHSRTFEFEDKLYVDIYTRNNPEV